MATAIKTAKKQSKAKSRDTKPDYKIFNYNHIAKKMTKHSNLYPRLRLFVRGFNESVTPQILKEFLAVSEDEFNKMKVHITSVIETLEHPKA